LEDEIPQSEIPQSNNQSLEKSLTKQDFIADVREGLRKAPMSVRLTPHILSMANWQRPLDDPIIRQFVPLGSSMMKDSDHLALDSLHEEADSRKYHDIYDEISNHF
jgi:lysine 2,3-aminomutase